MKIYLIPTLVKQVRYHHTHLQLRSNLIEEGIRVPWSEVVSPKVPNLVHVDSKWT
jgi:hypothetical protein